MAAIVSIAAITPVPAIEIIAALLPCSPVTL